MVPGATAGLDPEHPAPPAEARVGAAIVGGARRSLGHPLSSRADLEPGDGEDTMGRARAISADVERVVAAREERDRRAGQCSAASGWPDELPAFVELQAAEEQLAAREAWLEWAERGF